MVVQQLIDLLEKLPEEYKTLQVVDRMYNNIYGCKLDYLKNYESIVKKKEEVIVIE